MSNKMKPHELRTLAEPKQDTFIGMYTKAKDKKQSQANAIAARKALIKTGEKK